MIGYFDGFTARGNFQERVSVVYAIPDNKDILSFPSYIDGVLVESQQILTGFLQRDALTLSSKGPTKPGPQRTMHVCAQHLQSLAKMYYGLLIAMTWGALHKKLMTNYERHFS